MRKYFEASSVFFQWDIGPMFILAIISNDISHSRLNNEGQKHIEIYLFISYIIMIIYT